MLRSANTPSGHCGRARILAMQAAHNRTGAHPGSHVQAMPGLFIGLQDTSRRRIRNIRTQRHARAHGVAMGHPSFNIDRKWGSDNGTSPSRRCGSFASVKWRHFGYILPIIWMSVGDNWVFSFVGPLPSANSAPSKA